MHRPGARIQAIGEAKATNRPVGEAELAPLDAVVPLLAARGHDVTGTRRLLFSRSGFTAELRRLDENRSDLELVDLERLYSGS